MGEHVAWVLIAMSLGGFLAIVALTVATEFRLREVRMLQQAAAARDAAKFERAWAAQIEKDCAEVGAKVSVKEFGDAVVGYYPGNVCGAPADDAAFLRSIGVAP